MFTTVRLEREDFDNYCRYAGACDYDVGNNGNSGTNGNGCDNSGVVALWPSGNEGARGPAGGRKWTSHVGVSHTLSRKTKTLLSPKRVSSFDV